MPRNNSSNYFPSFSNIWVNYNGAYADNYPSLVKPVQQNEVEAIKQVLRSANPERLVHEDLLCHAPSKEMVFAILNYTPAGAAWTVSPSTDADTIAKRIRQSNIKHYFRQLVNLWPEIAREILNDCILLEGKSLKDPDFSVHVTAELLVDDKNEKLYQLKGLLHVSLKEDNHLTDVVFTRMCCKSLPGLLLFQDFHILHILFSDVFRRVKFLEKDAESSCCGYNSVSHKCNPVL